MLCDREIVKPAHRPDVNACAADGVWSMSYNIRLINAKLMSRSSVFNHSDHGTLRSRGTRQRGDTPDSVRSRGGSQPNGIGGLCGATCGGVEGQSPGGAVFGQSWRVYSRIRSRRLGKEVFPHCEKLGFALPPTHKPPEKVGQVLLELN